MTNTPSDTLPVIRRMVRDYARRYGATYAVAFVFMAVVAGCTAFTAWMMRDVINEIFVAKKTAALVWIPLTVAAIFIIKGVAAYGQEILLSRVGNSIVADMQKRIFENILHATMDFHQKHASSELITRVSHNTRACRDLMNLIAISLGRDIFTILGLLAVMLMQDPIMSAIVLLFGPAAVIGMRRLTARIKKATRQESSSFAKVIGYMRETSQGIRTVKSFQLEPAMRSNMFGSIEAVEKLNNKMVAVKALVNPLMETTAGLSVAAVVMYAGWRTMSAGETPGEFFSFITALLLIGEPARRLSRLQLQLVTTSVQVKMLYDLLDQSQAERGDAGTATLETTRGAVRFDDVHFAYGKGESVLKGLSFEAPGGKTTALVGLSGSGKTTIFSLLQGLWEPEKGEILIDGQAIADVHLASLRQNIALVSQDAFLFDGTVRENLIGFSSEYTDRQMFEAAGLARADEFINRLPKKYETRVGELGGKLSGGQRQRISIARAFLKNAPIILLDEPTSALDSETEQHIQAALDKLTADRTTIVIAHRLSTIANADIIHVVEGGRIIESGTERELLLRAGRFARFHAMQFKTNGQVRVAK